MSAAIGLAQFGLNMASNMMTGLMNQYFIQQNMQEQARINKALFDYEAEYNDPTHQMQRLQAAGLNPNLVYGSSSPAGVQGSAPVVSGANPGFAFNSVDLAQVMSQVAHSKDLEADANLKDAQANWYNKQSGRYDELLDAQIEKTREETNVLCKQLNVMESDIRYKDAQTALSVAQEQYQRGEIGLQEWKRQQIAAQIMLWQKQSVKVGYDAKIAENDAIVAELEAKYLQIYYEGDNLRSMSESQAKAAKAEFEKAAAAAAARTGIEGSEAVAWIDWITKEIGQIFGGANQLSSAVTHFRRKR